MGIVLTCIWVLAQAAPQTDAVFPLKVSGNGRYLVDQKDRPFLVVGDTPWSLMVQPAISDIERYLADRQARGFNSIIVNLIEHKFCSNPPKTRSGLAPFDRPGDLSTPNRHYFDFAHEVVQKANALGIVVWLAPAYLGAGGGDEGFFQDMKAGGKQKLRDYGAFVGERFNDLPNIIWVLGGDYTPDTRDRWTVTELAEGIHSRDARHLMTVHNSPENSAASVYGQESWLTVDAVYSYERTLFRPVLAEYAVEPARPYVLIESTYEGEHKATPDLIRRQAYWAMLGGACGQFLGNNPLWHFDGPGLYAVKQTWQEALDSTGSRDISRLASLFQSLPWHQLRPEENHSIVTLGYGKDVATALTAQTVDRRLSVTYVPSIGTERRELIVDSSRFAGPVSVRWRNPTIAGVTPAEVSVLPNEGTHRLLTPGDNGTGANDWVLLLKAY